MKKGQQAERPVVLVFYWLPGRDSDPRSLTHEDSEMTTSPTGGMAGVDGFEPTSTGVKGRCLIRLATPLYVAQAEGFEPPRAVLETAMLPLHQTYVWSW